MHSGVSAGNPANTGWLEGSWPEPIVLHTVRFYEIFTRRKTKLIT